MAGLEITIGGDASGFERELSDVEKQLQTLERRREARVRIGADTGDLDRRITQTTANLTRLRSSLNQTTTSAQNFNRQTANGSNTLTQFSRIAQDAPFGIMGIGNNLTATAEAFSNLSRSAGGARGALAAVGQSLLGGGGILLAISLVTTGLTLMSQKGLTLSDVFNKLTGSFDENRSEMQKMNVEISKNAQAEISSVGAYVYAAKNINLSMEERLIAVKKLQDEYPAYFGNLTKEQILNGNVAGAVREVAKALIDKAKAAAYSNKIVDLTAQQEELQNKANNAIAASARLLKLNNAEAFRFAKTLNEVGREGGDIFEAFSKFLKGNASFSENRAVSAINTFQDISKELNAVNYQIDRYTDKLNDAVAGQIKLEATKPKAPKKVNVTPQVQALDFNINTVGIIETAQQLEQLADGTYRLENNIKSSLSRIPGYFNTAGQGALLELQKFNQSLNEIINSGIVDTLSGLANAIGSAFATGGNVLNAVGKSLLSTLGGVLTELGKMAITTGIGILAIQTALKTLNPYVAIAAGVALVALGGAVSSGVKNIGNSASGGGSATSGNTGADYRSPSSNSYGSSSAMSTGGTVVFEIDGQKLVGVLSNTLERNSRLGGSLGIN